MGIPDDIAALQKQVDALTQRVVALETKPAPTVTPAPPSAEGVISAVNLLDVGQRKNLWRMLRDGK